MKIVIIKYNAGNIQSVLNALLRLGYSATISDNANEIRAADRVIFPGVGEASSAMKYLQDKNLNTVICSLTQPVLGICLGMQLLCRHSEENNTHCLHIFQADVKRFKLPDRESALKIPHTGWNSMCQLRSELFKNIPDPSYAYFVHSYYVGESQETIAVTNHITRFSSALKKNNFYGVQFHPEKSSDTGDTLLKNFVELC